MHGAFRSGRFLAASTSLLFAACSVTPASGALRRELAGLSMDEPAGSSGTSGGIRDPFADVIADAGADAVAAAPEREAAPEGLLDPQGGPRRSGAQWRPREVMTHGWAGAGFYDFEREGGSTGSVDDDVTVPTVGGGAAIKLAGDGIDLGFEGMLSFSWSGNVAAFASSGGGAVVAVDVDMYMFELFGGPIANVFLGSGMRIYGSAGPVMQWASYEQDGPTQLTSGDGDGFGVGWYARTGFEFSAATNTMIGIGARWTDTEIDLGGSLGDLSLQGVQAFLTVTHGL